MKLLYVTCIMAALCLLIGGQNVSVVDAAPHWEQVPLKTEEQQAGGFAGGDGFQYVHAITYAPSDPTRAYLTVDMSAVWRSDDSGMSWRPMFKGFNAYGGRSLVVDPLNPDIVFVAGFLGFDKKRADKYSSKLQGIYVTKDGGKSWVLKHGVDFYKQQSKGELFVFVPTKQDVTHSSRVYCGSYDQGLLLTEDGGETWRSVGFKGHEIIDLARGDGPDTLLVATNKGLFRYENSRVIPLGQKLPSWPRSIETFGEKSLGVYAALGESGLFRSDNGGQTFYSINNGLPRTNWVDVAVSPADSDQIYIRAHLLGRPPYYSNDGGKSWHVPRNDDVGGVLGKPGFFFSSPFAPHPTEPRTALHVTNGRARIIRTDDGGNSWKYSGDGFTGGRMVDAVWLDDGSHIFSLTDHGLWRSTGDGIYYEIPLERMFGRISSSSIAAHGKHIVASLGQWTKKGLIVSHDGGKSWVYRSDLVGRYACISFSPRENSEMVFAGKYVSSDNGKNWQQMRYTLAAVAPNGDLYAFDLSTPSHKYDIFSSKDEGKTWSKFAVAPVPTDQIRDVAVDPTNSVRVFLATMKGLYIKVRGGWSLKDHTSGIAQDPYGLSMVELIAFSSDNPSQIYVGRRSLGFGRSNGVFVSLDGGETWRSANYNLEPGFTVFGMKSSPVTGTMYLGSSFGTFRLVQ